MYETDLFKVLIQVVIISELNIPFSKKKNPLRVNIYAMDTHSVDRFEIHI